LARIDYLVPDYERPSWGIALLYQHVRLLRELGYDARVLHHRAPFRVRWVEQPAVPIGHLDALDREPSSGDLVVVPEVIAAAAARLPFPWRRVVFVQGSFLIPGGLEGAADYRALGYERALAVLPHVAAIVERHFGVAAAVVPPFVAPYFFRDGGEIARGERRRIVLFVMKPEYRRVGFPDYDIFMRLTRERFADRAGAAPRDGGWRLVELDGSLSHALVAELMAESAFLVNLNSHEAFNTTVPEAMAAGCIPVCYDAFGGQDFLIDGANAFVFPNHHVYPLVEKILALTAGDGDDATLRSMRQRARNSAARYDEAATRDALARVFETLAGSPAPPQPPGESPAAPSDS
jgi:glycosyltransferase involved in cell wall biosynthesis